jgi:hypothetical protein
MGGMINEYRLFIGKIQLRIMLNRILEKWDVNV